jgi:PPP family 3-phenylpropionic acid transporter
MSDTGAPGRALFSFGAVSFAYFAYFALFNTYAPLWFQSLGYSTLVIGALVSMQSATRLLGPYAWGWFADHGSQRTPLLRIAAGLALLCTLGFLQWPSFGWVATITVALHLCTSGIVPLSEAALSRVISSEGRFDVGRYGRIRVWGSIGFMLAAMISGFVLQWLGVHWFPALLIVSVGLLLLAAMRLPVAHQVAHFTDHVPGVLAVLRQPAVAWFFGGFFFTVLAHVSLYAFLSLYLVELGYTKSAIGLIWAWSVLVEVLWFCFQSRWLGQMTMHGWLLLAAVVTAFRCAALAVFGGNVWILMLAQSTHAVTFAAQHTACIAVINRHFAGRLLGRGHALYSVFGYGVSGVVGGVAGGALSQAWGFAAVFWAASAAGVFAAICNWRALRLEQRDDRLLNDAEKTAAAESNFPHRL